MTRGIIVAKVIGLDFDDVLFNFNRSLCRFHNQEFGTNLTRDNITSYELATIWECTQDEAIERVLMFYESSNHDEMGPIDGAIGAISTLSEHGAKIVVVTSRPQSVRSQTHSLLEKHFRTGLIDSVHFASHVYFGNATSETKGAICRRLGIEVFIDDADFHAEEIAPVVEQVLVFDTPWNRQYTPTQTNIKRVHSWAEILEILT